MPLVNVCIQVYVQGTSVNWLETLFTIDTHDFVIDLNCFVTKLILLNGFEVIGNFNFGW